jgi:GT2 family glycosyltransferase
MSENVGLVTGRTVYYDRPDTVQYSWELPHFLGEAVYLNSEKKLLECPAVSRIVPMCPSTFLLVDKQAADHIGGFDDHYFFGRDDADFTLRLTAAGFDLVEAHDALARHRMQPRGFTNVAHNVRSRWYFMLKIYSGRTLFLISPLLLVDELLRVVFLTAHGAFVPWVKGTLWAVRDIPRAISARRHTQRLRQRKDSEFLYAGTMFMRPDLIQHAAVSRMKRLYDGMTTRYWRMVEPLV